MVGGLRAMTTRQLPPNCEEVITMLRTVLSQCTYPDLDLSTEEDAHTLLARRQCAEAAMHRLEIELGFREHRLRRKKTKHHAVESDNRGAPLNVAPLARGQYLLIKLEQPKRSCHRYDRIHPSADIICHACYVAEVPNNRHRGRQVRRITSTDPPPCRCRPASRRRLCRVSLILRPRPQPHRRP